MLEGGQPDERYREPPPEWRTYRLCKLYRCTPLDLDDIPAETNDWMLAMADIEERALATLRERANRG